MRLYTKIKPLSAGVTAGINNKGVMIINGSSPNAGVARLNVKNIDGSISTLDFTVAPGTSLPVAPNHCIIPLPILNWVDTSAPPSTFPAKVYELY
jgi:hypothetical protein